MTFVSGRLSEFRSKLQELEKKLSLPEVQSNPEKLKKISKEYKELREIVEKAEQLDRIEEEITSVK